MRRAGSPSPRQPSIHAVLFRNDPYSVPASGSGIIIMAEVKLSNYYTNKTVHAFPEVEVHVTSMV